LGVVGGVSGATNQYDLFNGLIFDDGFVSSSQYDFFNHLGTNRYEFFKSYNSVDPNIVDEYTFYQNTSDPNIYNSNTFYTYAAEFIYSTPVTPTPTPTNTVTPTVTPTMTNTPTPSVTPTLTSTPTPTPSQAPFTPDSISGALMWFSADAPENYTLRSDGGNDYVERWINLIPQYSYYDLVQGAAAYQPQYISDSTYFDNSGQDALQTETTFTGSSSSNSAMTIFIVGSTVDENINSRMFDLDKSGAVRYWKAYRRIGGSGANNTAFKIEAGYDGTNTNDNSYYNTTVGQSDTQAMVVQQSLASTGATSNRFFYAQGTNYTNTWTDITQIAGSTTFNTISAKLTLYNDFNFASATNGLEGNVKEFIWYDRILTPSEITQVLNYLDAKW
jgi:hypothetical protein